MDDLKRKITHISIKLFTQQGIRKTSMDNIARSLSISKRTVYEVFRTKKELLKECIQTEVSHYINELNKKIERSYPLRSILIINSLVYKQLKNISEIFLNEVIADRQLRYTAIRKYCIPLHRIFSELVEKAKEHNLIKKDIATQNITAFLKYIFLFNIQKMSPAVTHNVFQHFLQTYLSAVCTPEGTMQIEKAY